MSAFMSFAAGDVAFVLTDRATYDSKGVVRKIGRKVTLADSAPVAVTTRGDKQMGKLFASKICEGVSRFGTDEFLKRFETWLADMGSNDDFRNATAGAKMNQVVITGWSQARSAFHLTFQTDDCGQLDMPAFTLVTPNSLLMGGPLSENPEFDPSLFPRAGENPQGWALRAGPEFMEFFRRQTGRLAYEVEASNWLCVGGGVDLTLITSSGAHTETIRTWPDVIGQKIEPRRIAA